MKLRAALPAAILLSGCSVLGEPSDEPRSDNTRAGAVRDSRAVGVPRQPLSERPPDSQDDEPAGGRGSERIRVTGEAEDGPRAPIAGEQLENAVDAAFLPSVLVPRDPQTLRNSVFTQAVQALRANQPERAAIALEGLCREDGGPPGAAPVHAWALLENGDLLEARRRAQAGVEARDGQKPAWSYVLGEVEYREGRLVEASPHFHFALGAASSDEDLLLRAAECAIAAGDGESAVRDLDRLALLRPIDEDIQLMRARALSAAGRGAAALDLYQRLLANGSESDRLWDEAGMAAFQSALESDSAQDYETAARYFAEATVLDPQNARYFFNMGCALDWGGDPSGAETAYFRALELLPGYMKAVDNLVELLVGQGRAAEARRVLREQLRQPLTRDEAVRVEQRLAELAILQDGESGGR